MSDVEYYISSPSEPEDWFMTIRLNANTFEQATRKKDIIFECMKGVWHD